MSYDLTNHTLTNSGEEGEYRLEMWEPANEKAKYEAVIRIYNETGLVAEGISAMYHENMFGMDLNDFYAADKKTEELLASLAADK